MNSTRTLLLGVATGFVTAWQSPAYAQTVDDYEALLSEAKATRMLALEALRKADASLEALQGKIEQTRAKSNVESSAAVALSGQPVPLGAVHPVARGFAETAGASSLAERTVDHALCLNDACIDRDAGQSLSDFTVRQLGLKRTADYKSTDAAFQIQGGKAGNYAAIGPRFTRRSFGIVGDDLFQTQMWELKLTGSAAIAKDNSVTLGTWSDADGITGNSDMALSFDLRRSWMRPRPLSDQRKLLVKMLDDISKDCALALGTTYTPDLFDSPACREWVAKDTTRGQKYYQSGVAPFWGSDGNGKARVPEYYGGLSGKLGFIKETYFPLTDPAGTGVQTLSTLPSDLADAAATKTRFNPLEIKAYAGAALASYDDSAGWDVGIAGSLGWQRAVRYPAKTEDITLCFQNTATGSPLAGFSRCKEVSIAAPYTTDGIVAGAGFNLRPPLTWLGRPFVGVFGTYDTAVDQWILSVPLAFAVDKDGSLKAGVRFRYASDGETFYGEPIAAKATIGVFLETDLTFPFVP